MSTYTDELREMDLQLGDLLRENAILKTKLTAAIDECIRMRHKLEHIYAIAELTLSEDIGRVQSLQEPQGASAASEFGA